MRHMLRSARCLCRPSASPVNSSCSCTFPYADRAAVTSAAATAGVEARCDRHAQQHRIGLLLLDSYVNASLDMHGLGYA